MRDTESINHFQKRYLSSYILTAVIHLYMYRKPYVRQLVQCISTGRTALRLGAYNFLNPDLNTLLVYRKYDLTGTTCMIESRHKADLRRAC